MYTGSFSRHAARISLSIGGRVAWGKPSVRGGDVRVGVEEVVIGPVGHCVVHPQATVDGPERYRSGDADDRDVLAVGAANTVDRAERADAVRHQYCAQAVQPRIAVCRIGSIQLTARADPL